MAAGFVRTYPIISTLWQCHPKVEKSLLQLREPQERSTGLWDNPNSRQDPKAFTDMKGHLPFLRRCYTGVVANTINFLDLTSTNGLSANTPGIRQPYAKQQQGRDRIDNRTWRAWRVWPTTVFPWTTRLWRIKLYQASTYLIQGISQAEATMLDGPSKLWQLGLAQKEDERHRAEVACESFGSESNKQASPSICIYWAGRNWGCMGTVSLIRSCRACLLVHDGRRELSQPWNCHVLNEVIWGYHQLKLSVVSKAALSGH